MPLLIFSVPDTEQSLKQECGSAALLGIMTINNRVPKCDITKILILEYLNFGLEFWRAV